MKRAAIFMIASCIACFVLAAKQADFDLVLLSDQGQTAYRQVRMAPEFSIGGVGVAGIPSQQEMALRKLLREEFAIDALIKLLNEARPAGQIYALAGLHFLDPKIFERELRTHPDFLGKNIAVPTMRGCTADKELTSRLIDEIRKGIYDERLKREVPRWKAEESEKETGDSEKTEIRVIPVN